MVIHLPVSSGLTLDSLTRFHDIVEIHDENEKLLGVFIPANLQLCRQRNEEAATKFDPAEMDRRARETKEWIPMSESIARLERMARAAKDTEQSQSPGAANGCATR